MLRDLEAFVLLVLRMILVVFLKNILVLDVYSLCDLPIFLNLQLSFLNPLDIFLPIFDLLPFFPKDL